MEPEELLWSQRGGAAEQVPPAIKPSPDEKLGAFGRVPPLDERIPWGRAVSVLADRHLKTERWTMECIAAGYETLSMCLTIDPNVRGGIPVLNGTRITAAQALAELAETSGVLEFAEEFDIDPEVIRNMLGGLSLILHRSCTK